MANKDYNLSLQNIILAYSILFSGFIIFTSMIFTAKIQISNSFRYIWIAVYFASSAVLFLIIYILTRTLKIKYLTALLTIGLIPLIYIPAIGLLIFSPYSSSLMTNFNCPSFLNKENYGSNTFNVGVDNSGDLDGYYLVLISGENITFRAANTLGDFTNNLTKYFVISSKTSGGGSSYEAKIPFDVNNVTFNVSLKCRDFNQNYCNVVTWNLYQCQYESKYEGAYQLYLTSQNP